MKKIDNITKSILEITQLPNGKIVPRFIEPVTPPSQMKNFDGLKTDSIFCGILNLNKDDKGRMIPKIFIPVENQLPDKPYVYKFDPRMKELFRGFFGM